MRFFLALSLCGLVACRGAPPSPSQEAPPAPEAPPALENGPTPTSVVIISLDTVRADRLQVYGGRAETPNLNRFAAQGARFETAITNFPETAVSHWAMFTGALPAVHGNVPACGGSRYTGPTLAERLQSEGYATAAFIGGETLINHTSGLARGFGLYDDEYRWNMDDLKRPGAQISSAAISWMQSQKKPFFAFVHYFDAHFPYTPAAPWDTKYDPDYRGDLTGSDADLRPYRDGAKTPTPEDLAHILALYDGELSELDAIISPLLQAAGDQTLVIITSDHGESFEHGYWFNHKDALWEGVLRVPWLVRGPGVAAGKNVKVPVELVDMTPTVLGLLGLPPLEGVHGVDRSPELKGTASSSIVRPAHSITDPFQDHPQIAIRSSGAKLLIKDEVGIRYNLLTDPLELDPAPVDSAVSTAAVDTYQQRLTPVVTRWQGAELPVKFRDLGEMERLNALGYVGAEHGAGDGKGAAQEPGRSPPPVPPR